MILLITGTEIHPFDRLIQHVDQLAAANAVGDRFFVQLGHTPYEPKHCEWKRFISFGEMCESIEKASLVISHAGAGSALLCIQCGKRPIIIPRQRKYKEHIDDHQLLFARRLHQFDFARNVEEMADLETALREEKTRQAVHSRLPEARELVGYLDGLIDTWKSAPR